MTIDPTAQGWRHTSSEGFLAHVGGFWERTIEGHAEFGFLAQEIHANRNGVVHGGMLMTFIDKAFGQTARHASKAPRAATISLTTGFMAPMRIGSFAMLRPKVVQLTPRLAFMEGTLTCGEDILTSAQGVWRLAARDSR